MKFGYFSSKNTTISYAFKTNIHRSAIMKIIFDLDYTLLDTKKFKDKLADIFKKEGFAHDYEKYFKVKGINFDFEAYLAILKSEGRINEPREKELELSLAELMKRLDDYLFSGVENIFKHFKDGGHELILMTFGDKNWQEEKIKNLSIKKYLNKIIFEEKNKSESRYLKLLSDNPEKILIVNDNAKETKEMVAIIGRNAKVFLIDGPYSKNIKHDWPVHQLDELQSLYV